MVSSQYTKVVFGSKPSSSLTMSGLDFVTTVVRFLTNRLRVYSPSSENSANGLANLVVGGARAGGHADSDWTRIRNPVGVRSFLLRAEGAMADRAVRGVDIVGILDVESADGFGAKRCQRHRIARVITADYHHHIEGFAQQLNDSVLALLGRTADRVEGAKIFPRVFLAACTRHRLSNQLADG